MSADDYKKQAAEKALEFVDPGMRLGLGTGSTVDAFLVLLAARVREGLDVVGVPTSVATEARAKDLGIPLTTLDDDPYLDLAIDGADEIDGDLRLIKGGGGALLREKIVAATSERMIVIADRSKQVVALGQFPLPIEVVPFAVAATRAMVIGLASDVDCQGTVTIRRDGKGEVFRTDNGNTILDCAFGRIPEPEMLAEALQLIPGVVEHGLFLNYADAAVIAGPDRVKLLEGPTWAERDA